MTTIRAFFLQIRALFPVFEKGHARLLPSSSYAPGKIIPRYVLLFMHFPKRSSFVQFAAYIFFSKSIFFETKLFSLKFSNRKKNNQDTIIYVFQNRKHLVIIQ